MITMVSTTNAPSAVGPYSQAIKAGSLIVTSGQLPINPKNAELLTGSIEEQTHQVLQNLKAVLNAAGAEMKNVIKTTVFLADIGDFDRMNEVYKGYFPDIFPARSCFQVARLPKGAAVEIEAIAFV